MEEAEVAAKVESTNLQNTSANTACPSVVDRYYTRRYKIDTNKKEGEDMCILNHSNRVSVITVAESHPIISQKKTVSKVDYQVDKFTNRLDNKVTGKAKRGAQSVNPTSPLCHVTCEDGSQYTLRACIKGHLVEVNENLVDNQELLSFKPTTEGYIAIILCKLAEHKEQMDNLLTHEQYKEVIVKRSANG